MTRLDRRRLLGLAASTALTGCAAPAVVTRDDPRDPFEGGIGGTGIVGVLTDFGSLRVNGLRVELTSRTRLASVLGPTSLDALAPGMPLTIMATRTREALVAHNVQRDLPLVGTLRRDGTGLRVNGVAVLPEPGAVRAAGTGARVTVSGVWAPDGLIASRIDPAPTGPDVVAGVVSRTGASGFAIGGVSIEGAASFPPAGSFMTALGRYDGAAFRVERLSPGRFRSGTAALRQLAVEGYLEPVQADPGFRIAGLGHSFVDALRLSPLARRRAIYVGPYTGEFAALAGYVVPENLSVRRQLLRSGFGDDLAARAVRVR